MIAGQLALPLDPPPVLTVTAIFDAELKTGEFYYALRELQAGRPWPLRKSRPEQIAFVQGYVR